MKSITIVFLSCTSIIILTACSLLNKGENQTQQPLSPSQESTALELAATEEILETPTENTTTLAPGGCPEIIEKEELIGIWQANGFMASGWSDRYHFYADGKFHFYPSLMICQDKVDEELGNWSLEEGSIVLTITSRVSIMKKCDLNGFGIEEERYTFELYQPETTTLKVVSLGILKDDFYPSILLNGRQYWKFSDDPTRYGDEEFPLE